MKSKLNQLFLAAALMCGAMSVASCTSDEITQSQPASSTEKIPFKAVIHADQAGTRGLTEATDGKSIAAKWEEGEVVAVVHGKVADVLTVESVDATSGAATISGEITSPANGEPAEVYVVYAGHEDTMVKKIKSDLDREDRTTDITLSDISKLVETGLSSQDGTWDNINNKLDYRFGEATLVVSDGNATFEKAPTLYPQFAVLKVSLTDGSIALAAKKLVMKNGTETAAAIDLDTDTKSAFYVAFAPDGTSTSYTFEATVANDMNYSCDLTIGKALESAKFYTATLKMTSNQYVDWSLDPCSKKDIPADAITMDSSTKSWGREGVIADDIYVVSKDVTIDGDVAVKGYVKLILMDGVTLTINGSISGSPDRLLIYGQANSSGKLNVTKKGSGYGIAVPFIVHGGEITATGVEWGIYMQKGEICVYGGKVKATATASTNSFGYYNPDGADGYFLKMFGGTFEAEGSTGIKSNGCNIYVEGGTLIARGNVGYGIASDASSSSEMFIYINGGELSAIGGEETTAFGPVNKIVLKFPAAMTLYDASSDPYRVMASGNTFSNNPPDLRYIVIK